MAHLTLKMQASSRFWLAPVLAAVLLVGLFACEESPRTTGTRNVENPWIFVQSAMPLLVLVRGRPSPAQETAVEDAVLEATRDAVSWTVTPRFTLAPAQAGSASTRLVYVFNGQPAADPCAQDVSNGAWQQGGRITLIAALCDGSVMLARVDGLLKRQDGVDDPRFRKLITQAARELLAPPPAARP